MMPIKPMLQLPSYFCDGLVLQQTAPCVFPIQAPAQSLVGYVLCRSDQPQKPLFQKTIFFASDTRQEGYLPALKGGYQTYTLRFYCFDLRSFFAGNGQRLFDRLQEEGCTVECLKQLPLDEDHVTQVVTIEDILVGEVWVMAGQGNMEMPLSVADQGKYQHSLQGHHGIRIFCQPSFGIDPKEGAFSFEPQTQLKDAYWTQRGDEELFPQLSAVGTYFALELERALNVPIGIVDTSLSEAQIHTWIDRETILSQPKYVAALKKMQLWVEADAWLSKSRKSIRQPSVFFNHKIAPLKGMVVRGMVFAQGEIDIVQRPWYELAFALQIKSWKKIFATIPGEAITQIYTGIPTFTHLEFKDDAVAKFNLMLARMRALNPNHWSYVSIADLPPDYDRTHRLWRSPRYPQYKLAWGKRCATVALGMAYHRQVPKTSPEISKVQRINEKLMLSFDHLMQGLCLKSSDQILRGFAICGADGVYRTAQAKMLYGMQVMCWHPDIPVPKQVTYGYCADGAVANLQSFENLGVAPFSTALDPGLPAVDATWLEADQLRRWTIDLDLNQLWQTVSQQFDPILRQLGGGASEAVSASEKDLKPGETVRMQKPFYALENGKKPIRPSEVPFSAIKRIRPLVAPADLSADNVQTYLTKLVRRAVQEQCLDQICPSNWQPVWVAHTHADVRMRIQDVHKRNGTGALEISYAGSSPQMTILTPNITPLFPRPITDIRRFSQLIFSVFNADGRPKDIRLVGATQWQTVSVSSEWQTFIFDLQECQLGLYEPFRVEVLDKLRSGRLYFDQFRFVDAACPLPVETKRSEVRSIEGLDNHSKTDVRLNADQSVMESLLVLARERFLKDVVFPLRSPAVLASPEMVAPDVSASKSQKSSGDTV